MLGKLAEIVESRGWILADGATGTSLFSAGLPPGEAPELWNVERPDQVAALCKNSIDAGAEIVLTNSFGSNRARLKMHQAGSRSFEISRISAEIARGVADSSAGRIVVAGSVGPTGELMEPSGPLKHSDAVEIFHEQMEGLKDGGVDVIWIETMSDLGELSAAAEAAGMTGMKFSATMSFDTSGRTMMGTGVADLTEWASRSPDPPIAIGSNCGAGASDLLRTLLEFAAHSSDIPIVAKGNAGIPKFIDGKIHYDGSPELMADYAQLARDAGARIIGGCCGTGPEHLRRMRERLESVSVGSAPEPDEIVERLGPFSSLATTRKPKPSRQGRRHRRRAVPGE